MDLKTKSVCAWIWLFIVLWAGSLAKAQSWGHLRTVGTTVAVMSDRSIDSDVRRMIHPGDWVQVDLIGNNWAAVFDKHALSRKASQAVGYVYAPLLEPYSHYMENIWETVQANRHDPRISLSEEFCKLDYHYDQNAVRTIVPQLSRVRAPHTEDLPDMLRRRTIRVLTTYAPSTYFISRGQGYGFEYSLLTDYEDHLNRSPIYGTLPTVLEFIPIPENLLIPSLKAGIGDVVAAGIRITPERCREVDFTIPYLTSVSEVLVVHSKGAPIGGIEDLSNRRIHIQPGWETSKTLRRINARLLIHNLSPMRAVLTDAILSSEDILGLINEGIIDLSIVESHIAHIWAETLPNITIHEFPEISEHTPIAWMVRKNNPDLKASLNRFLRSRRRGSHFGNIYYRQYFKQTRWINNPLAPTDQAKFSRYVPLFRKYGAQYGFDWMLLAAIAYQESEMHDDRRSRSGAVGLMQVMPSTSSDTSIDIQDITDPENNVHAGTKYLALLRDVYFSDPDLRPRDRIRFVLAAYNAGPTRIQQCRRLAERLGYDPNRWFQNTEIAALRLIGSETVHYVTNVKKYYLAYSLGHTMACLKAQHIEALKSGHPPPQPVSSEFARR
jgi:membrane-bound lytic murein transglycosylase MltF